MLQIKRQVTNFKQMKISILTTVLTLTAFTCFSQKTFSDSLSKKLNEIIIENQKIFSNYDANSSQYELNTLDYLFAQEGSNYRNYEQNMLEYQRDALRKDWGLSFHASYNQNFGEGLENSDENFTIARTRIGLDWDLVHQGIFNNKLKIKLIDNKIRLSQIDEMEAHKENNYSFNYNFIIHSFDIEKTKYLDQRLEVLLKQKEIFEELHLRRYQPYSEVLGIEAKVAKTKNAIKHYNSYIIAFSKIFPDASAIETKKLPVLKLDLNRMLEVLENSPEIMERRSIELENISQEKWLQRNIRLKLYVRHNYNRGLIIGQDRDFVTAGAILNVPINTHFWKEDNYRKDLLISQVDENSKLELWNKQKELMNYYYEYEHKLNQWLAFTQKLETQNEILRLDRIKNDLPDFNFSPLTYIRHQEQKLDLIAEIIEIKQQLYLLQLKIFTVLTTESPLEYSEVVTPDFNDNNERLIVWDLQSKEESPFIKEYLKSQKLIPIFEKTDEPKGNSLSYDLYSVATDTLWVDVNSFRDRVELEKFIKEKKQENQTVCLKSLKELIALDERTLN